MARARVALLPVAVLVGAACAVATVALYQLWWGLLLAVLATLSAELAVPRGWATRLVFALAFDVVVGLGAVPRGAGDYLVASTASGYGVLVLALVVLLLAIATLPRPGRREFHRPAGGTPTLE
ncbi:hypothetical protein G5V58_17060 [Nocardioides anomalus]|uniref:Uncharacterized protein n=1 Tax=Nocardioides anomalus TaxID=2712223 RepID=A0A6G6WG91_9ACTN|nr:hypothetical protein [Nocardioides anomalus]QIG44252.1 hypothetical protein G5V58_17060 [Nocardioides anomalus]